MWAVANRCGLPRRSCRSWPGDRTSWPDGVPALQIGGDFAVESELDRLNRYNEPQIFQSHMLDGIPVTPVAINELEEISGTMISRGLEPGAKLYLMPTTFMRKGKVQTRQGPNMAPLLNRLVRGKTWREALNALFTSPEYARWNANPEFTNNGSMSDDERGKRPGTVMVDKINEHYTNLLGPRFIEAGANNPELYPGAAQYLKDRKVILPTGEDSRDGARTFRDVTRGTAAAQ